MSDPPGPQPPAAAPPPTAGAPSAGPVRPPHWDYYGEYDENGVDLSLLRWMLSLTPLERLRVMEAKARETLLLLEYGRRHREAQSAQHR